MNNKNNTANNAPNLLICTFYLIKEIFKYFFDFLGQFFDKKNLSLFLLISLLIQIVFFILYIKKYNIDYLLKKYRPRKIKNPLTTNVENYNSINSNNPLISINNNSISNPPVKNNKNPRKNLANKENIQIKQNIEENNKEKNKDNNIENNEENNNNLIINVNDSIDTIVFNNNELNINDYSDLIINTIDNKIYYNKNFLNYEKELKLNIKSLIKNYYKKYVPFISIFFKNDLNIYLIIISLFLFWFSLYVFFYIINVKFIYDWSGFPTYITIIIFSSIILIIMVIIINFKISTSYDLYNVLIHKIPITYFKKKYNLIFKTYFILSIIYYLIAIFISLDFFEQYIFFLVYYLPVSIVFYVIIIPLFLFFILLCFKSSCFKIFFF